MAPAFPVVVPVSESVVPKEVPSPLALVSTIIHGRIPLVIWPVKPAWPIYVTAAVEVNSATFGPGAEFVPDLTQGDDREELATMLSVVCATTPVKTISGWRTKP